MQSPVETWNRKLHYYGGLYFLFFLWLFSISGLILNHPLWRFAGFWPQRNQVRYERPVESGSAKTGLERAREIMKQAGIYGEVEWITAQQRTGHTRFRVARPGRSYEIDADESLGKAAITEIAVNGWGVLNSLHHFNGVHAGDDRNARDWIFTTLWTAAMDALAAGLLAVLASGIYLWCKSGRRRVAGSVALIAGLACVAAFLLV